MGTLGFRALELVGPTGRPAAVLFLFSVNGANCSLAVVVGLINRGIRVRRSSGNEFMSTGTINLGSKKSTVIMDKVYQPLHDNILICGFIEAPLYQVTTHKMTLKCCSHSRYGGSKSLWLCEIFETKMFEANCFFP